MNVCGMDEVIKVQITKRKYRKEYRNGGTTKKNETVDL